MQDQPTDELTNPTDPAKLGSDQGSGFNADDPRAMPRTPLNAVDAGDQAGSVAPRPVGEGINAPQGSDFDAQRRQGSVGDDNQYGAVGHGQGMGRAGFNGDQDRGYDESGIHGGVGSSGGREDLSDRAAPDSNAFTGGYGSSDYDRPSEEQTQHLGLNTPNPTDNPDQDNLTTPGAETV